MILVIQIFWSNTVYTNSELLSFKVYVLMMHALHEVGQNIRRSWGISTFFKVQKYSIMYSFFLRYTLNQIIDKTYYRFGNNV